MQIQQAVQNILTASQAIPAQVLNELSAGKQLEAVVVKVALEAQVATLKVADTLIDIRTSTPVQPGQTVQLELDQSSGKPVVKIITPTQIEQTARTTAAVSTQLIQGQQVAVEVVKLLAENKVLVEIKPNTVSSQLIQPKTAGLQVEIDTSRLNKQFASGEKAQLEVISTKPLNVVLKAQPVIRDQAIVERIQQLLTQQPKTSSNFGQFNQAGKIQTLPSSVQGEISNLLSHITDKQQVNRPQVLKQAIERSGSFTEKLLLQQNKGLQHDFKANIFKLISSIEREVEQHQKAITLAAKNESSSARQTNPSSSQQVISTAANKLVSPFASSQPSRPQTAQVDTISAQAKLAQVTTDSARASQTVTGNGERQQTTVSNPLRSPFAPQKLNPDLKTAETLPANKQLTTSDTKSLNPSQSAERNTVKPSVTTSQSQTRATSSQSLAPLSALIQASLAHGTTKPSVSVLSSPPQTSLPTTFTLFVDSVLTTPNQALAVAKMLSQSISSEQVRGLQMDLVVLQNLLREVESIQARVQLNQFSMLKEPETTTAPTASWLLDIPLKDKNDVDFLQLQIEQHQAQEEEDSDIWNVQLRLDTQNLGPLQATVTLREEDLKLVLRAEKAESAKLIERYIDVLQQSLVDIGVSVSSISCICGEVAKATLTERYLSETTSLVDISV